MGYFPLPLVLYIVLLSFIHYFTLTFRWTRVTPDTPKVRLWGNRLCSFLQDVVPLQKAVGWEKTADLSGAKVIKDIISQYYHYLVSTLDRNCLP